MDRHVLVIGLLIIAGCAEMEAPPPPPRAAARSLAEEFDPARSGSITGRVTWDGAVPAAKQTIVRVSAFNPQLHKQPARYKTPHVPAVHPDNAGVANAIVYLKSVDPHRSKPWRHAPVRIAFQERQLRIEQGDVHASVGVVRRGDRVEIINRDHEYHNLRGRGAAFFSVPLVEANKRHDQTLAQAGVVDLTCSAGYYWLHGHLFVADHPYFARTDADGRFTLDEVPAGAYDVVCWLPSWRVESAERDPEIAVIARFAWQAPQEQAQTVTVEAGQTREIHWTWNPSMFDEPGVRK